MSRLLLLAPASMLLVAALLGCDNGVDSDPNSLPTPAIFASNAPAACGTPGSTSIALDLFATQVFENLPQSSQLGPNQVQVSGVITGLTSGHAAYGIVLDDVTVCPVISWNQLTVTADGAFTARMRITTPSGLIATDFRVLVVTGPAGATPSCGADDCLQLDAGGTPASLGGISNAIGIRL